MAFPKLPNIWENLDSKEKVTSFLFSPEVLASKEANNVMKKWKIDRLFLNTEILEWPPNKEELAVINKSQAWIFLDSPDQYEEKIQRVLQARRNNKSLSIDEIKNIVNKVDEKYNKKRTNSDDEIEVESKEQINTWEIKKVKNTDWSKNIEILYGEDFINTKPKDIEFIINSLSDNEKEIIWIQKTPNWLEIKNPEVFKNTINFYTFFKDLNLLWIWEYRWDLVKSMQDINIRIDDEDSINKQELIKFWNQLIDFINNKNWEENKNKQINHCNSINELNMALRSFSEDSWILNSEKTFNIYWEDKFTAVLRELWIIWWAYFHIMKFKDIIDWKNKKATPSE